MDLFRPFSNGMDDEQDYTRIPGVFEMLGVFVWFFIAFTHFKPTSHQSLISMYFGGICLLVLLRWMHNCATERWKRQHDKIRVAIPSYIPRMDEIIAVIGSENKKQQ